jgi:uncharacterized protein YbcC (UPF0753/DUF2309 family)
MSQLTDAIVSLYPTAQFTLYEEDYSRLEWYSENIPKPSKKELQDHLVILQNIENKNNCKAKAKQLLAASDWAVLPDVGLKNSDAYITYRGILRGLVIQPQINPDFPTEPTPVWL